MVQERERERVYEMTKQIILKQHHVGNLNEGYMGILCTVFLTLVLL